jgi:triosephosphate isomerase
MRDKPLIVANWKATKTTQETIDWIGKIKTDLEEVDWVDVVVCPPFSSLSAAFSLFKDTNIKIGAQDVSRFKKGAYTGEVTVEMLRDLVTYCIVGHSERRKHFGESDDNVIQKVRLLLENKITPVLCVSDLRQLDSYGQRGKGIIEKAEKIIFVYEPPSAISGGGAYRPEEPSVANKNAGKIGKKIGEKTVTLYGGSVNPDNAPAFFSQANIDGGLSGQASTDPQVFLELLKSVRLNTSK